MINTKVCIIGAGAGGIGCAYRLIKRGIDVVIVDKNSDYGGTMTFGGIDGWEPGVSLDGIHTLIKDELEKMPNGCHVVETVPNLNLLDGSNSMDFGRHSFAERPWGYDAAARVGYESTMGRCPLARGDNPARRFQFDGDCFIKAIRNIFEPYREHITELFGYSYLSCVKDGERIKSVTVSNKRESITITADFFIDASGDIVLARDAGCECVIGTEGHEEFFEPSSKEKSDSINAVTYAFRVRKTDNPEHVDAIPERYKNIELGKWVDEDMKRTVSLIVQYPCGDLHVNMLPTMQGAEYFSLGELADEIGKARVYKYWHYLQSEKGLSGYTLVRVYSAGVRESYRLRGRYVLCEQDLRRGKPSLPEPHRTVAIADHHMDIHGSEKMSNALEHPYEVPIECAMTKEYENLFVACRGASFTHIASSSVRLSRTMLSFGEGVGEYIADIIEGKL